VTGGTVGVCENCSAEIDFGPGGFCPVCGWPKSDTVMAGLGEDLEAGIVSCPACWEPNPPLTSIASIAQLGSDTAPGLMCQRSWRGRRMLGDFGWRGPYCWSPW